MSKKAMKLALEALQYDADYDTSVTMQKAAIYSLEEALAKQEQGDPIGYISEPVAKLLVEKKQAHGQIRSYQLFTHDVALYTTPPKQEQGELAATERQVEILTDELANCQRALEKQEQGEPVAWRREFEGDVSDLGQWLYADEYEPKDDNPNWQPLYTTPQLKQEQDEQDEFLLRGVLASELKCWHRLTADESQNLIDFVKNMGAKQEQGKPDYWLGYGLQAHTEKPFEGATPLYKELK
jgi:hypothetical protein